MNDNEIIKAWEKVLATGDAPIEEGWGCVVPFALVKRTLDAVNRQKETIQNQDEMIRGLINAQETLQKEIKELKKGHILYDGEV